MRHERSLRLAALVLGVCVAVAGGPARAQSGSEAELAKELQNPVSDLISLPLENRIDRGPGSTIRNTLNFQPVLPFELGPSWNVVSRTIIPFVYAESPIAGGGSLTGLGDITQAFFFAPRAPVGGWILGAGPVLQLPTASETGLGGRVWGGGPTAVALRQDGAWTWGALVNHVWSFAGTGADVNRTLMQPFFSYTLPTLTFVGAGTETIRDWHGRQWLVPIDAGVSQLVILGGLPVVFGVGGRYYAERPTGGPDWAAKLTVTVIPRKG